VRTGATQLSSLMRRIHTGFAVRFNLRYGRSGYLFQSRFGSRLVRDEAGLRAVSPAGSSEARGPTPSSGGACARCDRGA